MSFRGQYGLAKMTSIGGKLIALACHPTKKVNKAEEITYLYTNIGVNYSFITFQSLRHQVSML
jgi:hypothetical protein